MNDTFKNLLLLGTAIVALGGGYWLAESMRAPEPITTPAYGGGEMIDFSFPDLKGKARSLKDWRGQVIVLNFWATWCPPCREEIPLLISFQKNHAAEGLQIIGIAIDNLAAVTDYGQSMGINYPLLIGGDDATELAAQYGNRSGSIPFTVIIDRDGAIAARKIGVFSKAELNKLIDPLLKPIKVPSAPNS
jgi:thiol-disulfide isomerase/thioredoxin